VGAQHSKITITIRTEKCEAEKWRILFFGLRFFRPVAETVIKACLRIEPMAIPS
jgi:hypothetical protein